MATENTPVNDLKLTFYLKPGLSDLHNLIDEEDLKEVLKKKGIKYEEPMSEEVSILH